MSNKPVWPYPENGTPATMLVWAKKLIQVLQRWATQLDKPVLTGTLSPQLESWDVPAGWLLADGSTKLRTDFPNLFAQIGTAFNTGGEASTEFRLPGDVPFAGAVWIIKL